MSTTITTELGVTYHAQVQTINGRTYEFQPEHLFCDDCWKNADLAMSMSGHFGPCTSGSDLDENFQAQHSITVTLRKEAR